MPYYKVSQQLDCCFYVEADNEDSAQEQAWSKPISDWLCDGDTNVDVVSAEEYDSMIDMQG